MRSLQGLSLKQKRRAAKKHLARQQLKQSALALAEDDEEAKRARRKSQRALEKMIRVSQFLSCSALPELLFEHISHTVICWWANVLSESEDLPASDKHVLLQGCLID